MANSSDRRLRVLTSALPSSPQSPGPPQPNGYGPGLDGNRHEPCAPRPLPAPLGDGGRGTAARVLLRARRRIVGRGGQVGASLPRASPGSHWVRFVRAKGRCQVCGRPHVALS